MYKLILSLRYLVNRWVTGASVLFVTVAVMALIVINAVMGGFQLEFKARLRGTLSDITITLPQDGDVAAAAARVEAAAEVAATSPRKAGLVLLGFRRDVQGCKILGIDPAREARVGQLESYLLTPYRLLKADAQRVVEARGARLAFRLLGVCPQGDEAAAGAARAAAERAASSDRAVVALRRTLAALRGRLSTESATALGLTASATIETGRAARAVGEALAGDAAGRTQRVVAAVERTWAAAERAAGAARGVRGTKVREDPRTQAAIAVAQTARAALATAGAARMAAAALHTVLFCELTRWDPRWKVAPELAQTQLVALRIGADQRVAYIHRYLRRPELPALAGEGSGAYATWSAWLAELNARIEQGAVAQAMAHVRPDLTDNLAPLDPARPFRVGAVREHLFGPPRPYRQPHPGILVGGELYANWGMRAGEVVELVTARRNETTGEVDRVSERFVIAGRFKTGMNEYDSNFVYAPHDAMVRLLEPTRGNELGVALVEGADLDATRDQLAALLGSRAEVKSWQDIRRSWLNAIHLERRIMYVILGFIVTFAVVTISVILILLVVEKTRDIGILKSMGATPAGLSALFVSNGMIAGGIGCLMGAVGGVLVALNVNELGDSIYRLTGWRVFPRDVYYLERIPVDVQPMWVTATIIGALALCLLCCAFPARRAGRLPVVEALHWD